MAEQAVPKKSKSPGASGSNGASDDAVGAPVPKDAIDPELVNLRRPPPKVGMVTAFGIVLLCAVFWFRLGPDRAFGGNSETPKSVAIGDVLAGRVASDQLVSLTAEPMMAHAVRTVTSKGAVGLRVVPVRGSGDRLWLVIDGDGADAPVSEQPTYSGRLRPLEEMPFAKDVSAYLISHPRPVFAPPAAVRAALASGKLRTVTGDEIALRDSDELAVDVIDLNASVLAATINERFPDAKAWDAALAAAGLSVTLLPAPQTSDEVLRYSLAMPAAAAATALEKAGLWAARIEPVLRNHRGTWGQLKASTPEALTIGGAAVPDVQIDLVGVMVARGVPEGAFALVASELPGDYWYVMPLSIALLVLGALFTWIFVRAVRRDLMAPKSV